MKKQKWFPYALVLPAVLIVALFIVFPIIQAVSMSFHSIGFTASRQNQYVGLSNYHNMLINPSFRRALRVTLTYTVGSVLGAYLIGLATALLMNMRFRGRHFARMCLLLPWALPQVVVAMIWMLMYDYQYGIVNYLFMKFGLIEQNVNWLGDPSGIIPMIAVLLTSIWNQFPVAMLMLLAGLLMIPSELYEAADIDGAGVFQRFRYITLPGLRSVTNVLILLFTIWAFKRFDLIYLMTQGGPLQATETLIVQTYQQAFQFWNMGYAATLGMFSLVLSLLFSAIYLQVVKFGGESML